MKLDRTVAQHKFYTDLSPQGGQMIAHMLGGFSPPSMDIQEAEIKDSLTLWMKMQESGAGELLTDAAWWMHHALDPNNRMTREEANRHTDELMGFAVAAVSQLMEAKILTFVKDPEIPEIRLSTYEMAEADADTIADLEKQFQKDDNDE